MKRLILFLVILSGHLLHGQETPQAPDGEIEDAQVIIEKNREIILPNAQRYFEKIDDRFKPSFDEQVALDFTTFPFQPNSFSPAFSAVEFEEPEQQSIGQNEIRLGYGNYQSPMVKATLHSSPNEKFGVGADFNHLSFGTGPIDDENSASSQSRLSVKGQFFAEKGSGLAQLAYQTISGYYYGYNPSLEVDRDSIKQVYNTLNFNLGFRGYPSESVNYQLNLAGNLLNDDFDNGENKFELKGLLDLKNEGLGGKIEGSAILSTYNQGSQSATRNLYRITPQLRYGMDNWSVYAGARMAILNDDLWQGEDFNIFPFVKANLSMSQAFNLQVEYSGDIETRFLQDVTHQNFWVTQDVNLNHSLNNLNLAAMVSGSASVWDYKLDIQYKEIENMAFFVNSSFDPAQFALTYDPGTTQLFKPSLRLGYIGIDLFQSYLNFTYFNYTTDLLDGAWYMPTYTVNWENYWQFNESISFELGLSVLGGIEAFDASTASAEPLDAALDLRLSADYKLTDQWLVFAEFNNILNSEYQLYLNYPNRGLMAKLGVSYSF